MHSEMHIPVRDFKEEVSVGRSTTIPGRLTFFLSPSIAVFSQRHLTVPASGSQDKTVKVIVPSAHKIVFPGFRSRGINVLSEVQETTFFTGIASKACLASKTIPFFQYPSTIELQKKKKKTVPQSNPIMAKRSDSGFIYNEQGFVDTLRSPFFDVNPTIDDTVEEYIERVIFTLSGAIEEQIYNVQWTITAKPQQG
ncbi:hypothetical protein M5K25_016376 [Dendrobium thyrsiflorum]|uniref:Uncharacterized protein n=1 Tax=Dendrobium thyrsiflorum TaxID=117978 RepID=A0ABD0URC7_DENTH